MGAKQQYLNSRAHMQRWQQRPTFRHYRVLRCFLRVCTAAGARASRERNKHLSLIFWRRRVDIAKAGRSATTAAEGAEGRCAARRLRPRTQRSQHWQSLAVSCPASTHSAPHIWRITSLQVSHQFSNPLVRIANKLPLRRVGRSATGNIFDSRPKKLPKCKMRRNVERVRPQCWLLNLWSSRLSLVRVFLSLAAGVKCNPVCKSC